MHLDGARRQVQFGGDLGIGPAAADQPQDLLLARGERGEAAPRGHRPVEAGGGSTVEEPAGDGRGEERPARRDGMHAQDQLARVAGLEHEPVGGQAYRFGDVVVLAEGRDEQAPHRVPLAA